VGSTLTSATTSPAPRTATNAVMPSSFATAVSWSSAHFLRGCLGRFATGVAVVGFTQPGGAGEGRQLPLSTAGQLVGRATRSSRHRWWRQSGHVTRNIRIMELAPSCGGQDGSIPHHANQARHPATTCVQSSLGAPRQLRARPVPTLRMCMVTLDCGDSRRTYGDSA